jgi:hypothetical protein
MSFNVPRGADQEFLLKYTLNKVPQTLTGAKIWATIRHSGTSALLFKRRNTAAGGGDSEIEIVSPQSGDTLGHFRLKFVPANTADLAPGRYYVIDVFVETAGGKRYQVIRYAVFEVGAAATLDFSVDP